MSHRLVFLVTVLVLVVSFSARSQESIPQKASDETAARQKKAIELLDSVAGQLGTLRSSENRARIGSNVAELLWNHDERRARGIFLAVEEDIRAGFNDSDTDDQTRRHTMLVFGQLRGNIIERIAKHDPELALEFLRATRPTEDPEQRPYEMEDEKSLELRLAGMIASKNPQLALKLGLQSLARGFSEDLLSVLSQLQRTDKATALIFFNAIVDKLKDANLTEDYLAMGLITSLAQEFAPPRSDEQAYRELIGVLWKAAGANGCTGSSDDVPPICYQIGSLYPRIEKYYGQRAASLKRWTPDAQNPEEAAATSRWGEIREVFEKGTVDEIMALAGDYPEFQLPIYSRAFNKARESGDLARATQIANNFPDESQRPALISQLDSHQTARTLTPEQLVDIQQQLSTIRGNVERVRFLLYVAVQLIGSDRKAALGLLDQADQLLASSQPGKAQVESQIDLAMLYCSLKSDRGFAIMEALMPKLNELVAAAAALDGFDNNYLRDGEWTMTSAGGVGSILTKLAQGAGYFANLDLERSITLASQLERPELRLMAKSKIAQALLSGQQTQSSVSRGPLVIR
jgi:hypothetical protein